MNLLLCCQLYYPSAGGVQTVMRQVAERLVSYGHSVTVATTKLDNRTSSILNGVRIVEFSISGNFTLGMQGDVEQYREFIRNFDCDAILINAAEQWTFDAIMQDLNEIKVRKVFIPCGFISFYDPAYEQYYSTLHQDLSKFDALVFHSTNYRDINYARKHGIKHCEIIPNGASEIEFIGSDHSSFRKRHQILDDDFLIFTVGAFSGNKGHLELAQAIECLHENNHKIISILNGNNPYASIHEKIIYKKKSYFYRIKNIISKDLFFLKKILFYILQNINSPRKIWGAIRDKFLLKRALQISYFESVVNIATHINNTYTNKRILVTDLPRDELIQAYYAADLFVFASHVEYSPLVLFEAAAAGTPFLTTDVGNAREIIDWLGGGFICESQVLENGNRIVNPKVLAQEIAMLMLQKDKLKEMGARMRKNWSKKYTWDHIAREYEKILMGKI